MKTITQIEQTIESFNNAAINDVEINDMFVNFNFDASKFAASGIENEFENEFFMFAQHTGGQYIMTFNKHELELS